MEDFFRFYGLLNAMNEQVKRYFQKFLPASAFAFSALLADSKVYWTSPIGHFDFLPLHSAEEPNVAISLCPATKCAAPPANPRPGAVTAKPFTTSLATASTTATWFLATHV